MKKIKFKIISSVLCIVATCTIIAFATDNDPVVSLSYLTDVFLPQVKTEISTSSTFKVLNVEKGKTFIGNEGCEFIVRGGSATSVVSKMGGITDVTSGEDIGGEKSLSPNHHLIIPRSDERGFIAVSDVIVMVKGSYKVR